MKLLVPSFVMPAVGVQLVVLKSKFCRKLQPEEGYGQVIFRVCPADAMFKAGTDWVGVMTRPMKSRLPVCVSRIKKRNG